MQIRFDWWRWLVICALGMMVLSMMCRCTTTRYVTVPEYHTQYVTARDTVRQTDSVMVRDSVLVRMAGDTVYYYKYRDRVAYKDRYHSKTDTLIVRDSIPYRVEVTKEMSKTDRAFLKLGRIAAVVMFIGIIILIGWIFRKYKDCFLS